MARVSQSPLYPIALSPQGAADNLGIDVAHINSAIAAGELPLFTLKRAKRIPVLSIMFWIENCWIKTGVGPTWVRPPIRKQRKSPR